MKKIFYTLLVVFTCFIGLNNVSAETINHLDSSVVIRPSSIKLNNTDWSINEFRNFYQGNTFNVKYDGIVYFNRQQAIWSDPFYIRYSLCTDGGLSGGWSNLSNVTDVRMYNTQIRCNFYGSNYDGGRVSFWSFALKPNDLVADTSAGTVRFSIKHDLSSAVLSDNSVGLLAIEYSMTPFPIYNENDTLIRQNDTLINSLNQVSSSNNQVIYEQQQTNQHLQETKQAIEDTNNTLNDDDTSESTSEATEFFEGFDTDTHGLTSIITAPLELIGNIAGSTCSPLPLQVPFINKTMSLPCMSTIYKKHFGSFLTVYQTITFGIVAYWVCVRIFALVKDFKNPEHDEIEVMDL